MEVTIKPLKEILDNTDTYPYTFASVADVLNNLTSRNFTIELVSQ